MAVRPSVTTLPSSSMDAGNPRTTPKIDRRSISRTTFTSPPHNTSNMKSLIFLCLLSFLISQVNSYCATCGDTCQFGSVGDAYCSTSPQGCTKCKQTCNFGFCTTYCGTPTGDAPVTPSPNDASCGDRCNAPCFNNNACNYGFGNTCTRCYIPPCPPWGCPNPNPGTCVTPSLAKKRDITYQLINRMFETDQAMDSLEMSDREYSSFVDQLDGTVKLSTDRKVKSLTKRQAYRE